MLCGYVESRRQWSVLEMLLLASRAAVAAQSGKSGQWSVVVLVRPPLCCSVARSPSDSLADGLAHAG